MKRGEIVIALLAALAVGFVVLVSAGDDGGGDRDSAKPAAGSVKVSFAYSPEKERLLKPLIERFNRDGRKSAGKPVSVEGRSVASGETESKIARGALRPVAWSPASSLWGRLLNFDADRPLAPRESPSIVRTPLVIAMWEPFARALGWPRKRIGFEQVLRLAREKRGFAAFGRPQFGDFKLVHTNPDFSTSGLSAVVAEYYAATGRHEGLTERQVTSSKARGFVRDIERSIVHYGDTTLFIADQMRQRGPGYASAVAMEEVTLLDFNRNRGGHPPLVALYPPEGTFYSDNPYITLDAPWVRPQQRAAAQVFQRWLSDQATPERAGAEGFRPAGLKDKPAGRVTKANGADPAQPQRVLGLPEPRVLNSIKETWRRDRKPANVELVLDVSGSMSQENRLERAKLGLEAFFREVSPEDRIGLTIFSDQIRQVVPIGPFSQNRDRMRALVRDLIADGGTAVYDATAKSLDTVRALRDRERINAVVVLTDGEDTDSTLTAQDVINRARAQGDSRDQVRVFTIAYSAEAAGAREALTGIAKASGGQDYEGNTEDIETVYRSISSFF